VTTFGKESPETLRYGADAYMNNGVLLHQSTDFTTAVDAVEA
jgi:hypothetical protein